jgi:hypothetical protein
MDILPQDFLLLLIEVKSAARLPQDVIAQGTSSWRGCLFKAAGPSR